MTEPAPEHEHLLVLAQAFQRGDGIAFSALYQHYKLDENYERATEAEQVQHAIAALPQEYREVIVLREYEDLSYREIATIVGCSEAAVKARLFKARRQLYEMLKEVFS